MSCYFIAEIKLPSEQNPQDYQKYLQTVKPIVEHYGGRYLVRTNEVHPVNGQAPERSIVIRFPDEEAMKACFSSAEYQSIAALRTGSVKSRAYYVEGFQE